MNYGNYFSDGEQVYYYNDLQIKQGLHEGKVALTEKELEEHLKPAESAEPAEVREVSLDELKAELTALLDRAKEITEKLEKATEVKNELDRN